MVIFPDIEKVIVAYLKSALVGRVSGVNVATKKVAPDATQPAKQIVVTASYNSESDYVLKTANVTLDVYANTYADANSLGLLVDGLITGVASHPIKRATVLLGPVRIAEDSGERRSLDVEMIVQGSPL